jgi:hypothetical protein
MWDYLAAWSGRPRPYPIATGAVAISAAVDFGDDPIRSLYVGGAGNVVVEPYDGGSVTLVCPAGAVIPLVIRRVISLTATGVLGLR